MIEVPADCRLVFCVGVGGVGKTTFAASLALREAQRGKSVLVLTADPARRLADALGLRHLQDTPSDVALPEPGSGELHAAMLETKSSADDIIRRAAADDGRAQRVLDNRIYQAFSNTLARSHAYAAMERIHQAVHDARYDLVVVDTPPAQSSIEILDAPARLVRFLDQRVVRWFLRASDDASGTRAPLAQRLLRKVAGDSMVSTLTEFLTEMAFLREGFATRAKDVRDFMQTSRARFVLVSSADAMGVAAAGSVVREVDERGFTLSSAVFNRAFVPKLSAEPTSPVEYPDSLSGVAPKLVRIRELLSAEQQQRLANMLAFAHDHRLQTWALPEATRPLGDTSALAGWIGQARVVEPGA